MISKLTSTISQRHGFALIEIAIALFVISIVLAGVLVPLTTQVQQKKVSDTQRSLDEAKDALIGFAVAYGRLPCPASSTSNGIEDPSGGGACTHPYDGFLPATTIGVTNSDGSGYAADAWNSRIRYAVTTVNTNAFTTTNGMKTVVAASGMAGLTPDLKVCSTATGIAGLDCAATTKIATNAVAVIYSVGPNAATGGGGTGADEAENLGTDRVFVFHTPSASSAPNGEFDDIFTWISPYILYSRMVSAGLLP